MNNETEHIFLLNPAPSESSAPAQGMGALEPPPISQVNLDNVKDFSHVCRTCATITEFVMPIFADEGLQNNLADKIHKHLPIKVCKGDELPLVVCYQCASTLLAWHELVQCCMQADAALRAKLRSNQRKTNRPNIKPSTSIEEDTESKPLQSVCAYRSCVYCGAAQPAAAYRQHLLLLHADLLFHCEVCDLLVERKDFLLHVSYHSIHYDTHDTIKKVKKELASQNPSPVPHTPAPQSTTKTETKPPDKTENKKAPAVARTRPSVQENEFSDHSDMDDFGPLPESVFEAIEDSQDSQQLQDNSNQTPDNERLGDESNKSSQLENKNSSDSAQCAENNDFTNICSVVDEPIDKNSCDQNVIKQSDTSHNIVLTANKTPSKTVEHNATAEKGKRNQNKLRKCPFCPKEYKASSSYFYHLKYFHKGSKEHECEVCGRKFGTRSCLTQHMAVHSAQYEFQCKQCHKQFKSKASLYIHEQTHGGKKGWSCNQCPAAFRWKTHLLRHAKRHAAERAHRCGTCGRAFSVRCDLLRHERTHNKGSFQCDKCGQKFAQLRYLKVHTMKQHKTNVKKSK